MNVKDNKNQIFLFLIFIIIGWTLKYTKIEIPNTVISIDISWILAYLSVFFFKKFYFISAIVIILSYVGPHELTNFQAFIGNLFHAFPTVLLLRIIYNKYLKNDRNVLKSSLIWGVSLFLIYILLVELLVASYIGYLYNNFTIKFIIDFASNQYLIVQSIFLSILSSLIFALFKNNRIIYENNKKSETILSSISDGVIVLKNNGIVSYMNPSAEKLTGISSHKAKGDHIKNIFNLSEDEISNIFYSIKTNNIYLENVEIKGKKRFFASFDISSIKKNENEKEIVIVFRDITKDLENKKYIEDSLLEKETLLKEIHHRVKNNMAVIVSILNLQAVYADDEKIESILKQSADRIQTMGIIHEFLYKSESLRLVSSKSYIERLIDVIISGNSHDKKIFIEKNIDNFMLTTDQMSPIGLILNEIISNSLKYGFVNNEKIIRVSFKKNNNKFNLLIEENGDGDPHTILNSTNLGINLIKTLVTQRYGDFEIVRNNDMLVFNINLSE